MTLLWLYFGALRCKTWCLIDTLTVLECQSMDLFWDSDLMSCVNRKYKTINPKMDMQKIVTPDGFAVRADPREHFVKNATLNKNQL